MQLWRLEYVRDRMRLDNLCLCLPIRMSLCVHSCMLRGSKTWLVKKENEFTLGWEWLGGCVILKTDRFSSSELREILGIDDMITLMQRHKLRLTCTCFKKGWECCCSFGHGSSLLWTLMLRPFYNRPIAVAQEGRSDWLKKWMDCEVEYVRSKGRPKKTWTEVMEKDCQLCKEDAMDHRKWRKLIKDVVYTHTNTHTHTTVLRPFFRDHQGELVPQEKFWTLWCKGRLTEAQTIRLGATPSGISSAHLHHPHFLQAGCPSCHPTNSVKSLKAIIMVALWNRADHYTVSQKKRVPP